jgi:hypothetical protein
MIETVLIQRMLAVVSFEAYCRWREQYRISTAVET